MKNCIKALSVFTLVSVILLSCELFGDKSNPKVTISEPANNSTYTTADLISFMGSATDASDVAIPENSLVWISDIDDTLGVGAEVDTYLSAGEHEITLWATDQEGNRNSDVIDLTVTQANLLDYTGTLHVRYVNTYPNWDVETSVEATLEGASEDLTFASGMLSYSGETLVSDDSKISREGEWDLQPTGNVVLAGSVINIEVDGGITVQNDVQKIWAKSDGDWVLVNSTPFDETPDASLVFSLNEARSGGSQSGVSVSTGSIVWTLTLIEE